MRQRKFELHKIGWANFITLTAATIVLGGSFPVRSAAQQSGQKTFSSPLDACSALIAAQRNNDQKALLDILGPDGKEIVSSGDDTEDAQNRANFVAKYQEMHRLVKEPDGTVVLYIGAANWPTPIPLEEKNNSWYFDTQAGKQEILFRRIGRNEMSTIKVCQELAAAQKEYYSSQNNHYAQKIFSDEGQHDGLYWKASGGGSESPIGPAVAEAFVDSRNSAATPFRGYYYRMLPAGSGGFAFMAYPAEYRSSGVMTFMIGQDGVVYQKDIGKNTEARAKAMKEYKPTTGWQKAEEQETAADQKTP